MAYDAARGDVVVFGGFVQITLDPVDDDLCGSAACSPESSRKLLILRRGEVNFPALWTRRPAGMDCAERLRLSDGRAS
jgi:hypothetical protein